MEEKEGKDRRRRYWIGDTAWGLGIVAALALPVLRHSVRDRFGLFFVFFTEVEVFECIRRDWFPLLREKSWPSKGGFSRRRRRDRDAGINSVFNCSRRFGGADLSVRWKVWVVQNFCALKRGRRDVTSSETRK